MRKIIIILFIYSLVGCEVKNTKETERQETQEEFYTSKGGWDWIRVPLLIPYEVKKIDPDIEKNTWVLNFNNQLINHAATNVKKVSIQDSTIYIICGDSTLFDYQYLKSAWYMVSVKKKTEKGFTDELEFKRYIKENNYPNPNWYDLDSLSYELGNGAKLPWLPK